MKSIKQKMLFKLALLIVIICLGFGVVSYFVALKSLENTVDQTLTSISEQSANGMKVDIQDKLENLETISNESSLNDANTSSESKLVTLKSYNDEYGYVKMGIADLSGAIKFTDGVSTNVSDRDYFKSALSGTPYVSDPSVGKQTKSILLMYSVPMKSNGKVTGVLVGIRDGNALSDFTNKIKVGKTGEAFMLNKAGTVIANVNKDKVMQMYNQFERVKKDSSLQSLVDVETKMIAGEKGTDKYTYQKVTKYVSYSPVNINGWSLAVVINENEVLSQLVTLKITSIAFSLGFLLASLIIIYFIAVSISNNIKHTSEHLSLLAAGDLTKQVSPNQLALKDEFGIMAKAMDNTQKSLVKIIKGITVTSNSIDSQSENLSSVSEEMAASTENLTDAIKEVSSSATSQAEDLVDVNSILNKFDSELNVILDEITELGMDSKEINVLASQSNSSMQILIKSVNNINSLFKDFSDRMNAFGNNVSRIKEITKLIDSIAEQTNLLALNAAIEAARAGESGKGFAVVAEEIRTLAEQSKASTQSIGDLTENIASATSSILGTTGNMNKEIENQISIVNTTIESFENIIDRVNTNTDKIEKVSALTGAITKDKNTIVGKIDNVSATSQEVSAASEEILASASELNASTEGISSSAQELSTMTKDMLQEVNKFKI